MYGGFRFFNVLKISVAKNLILRISSVGLFAFGVFFMQETHSDGSDTLKWQLEWGSQLKQFYLNHGQSNARGTAIAFKKKYFALK